MNIYAYTGNDPVNLTDPSGLDPTICLGVDENGDCVHVLVTAKRPWRPIDLLSGMSLRDFANQWEEFAQADGRDRAFREREERDRRGQARYSGLGPRPTGAAPYYFNGRGWPRDPLYRESPYSTAANVCFAVCPPVAGLMLATAPGIAASWGRMGATPQWTLGENHTALQWANRMARGGWTDASISEALGGARFEAPNFINPMNGATRFVHPESGLSVVIDNITREIIHLGAPGFGY